MHIKNSIVLIRINGTLYLKEVSNVKVTKDKLYFICDNVEYVFEFSISCLSQTLEYDIIDCTKLTLLTKNKLTFSLGGF